MDGTGPKTNKNPSKILLIDLLLSGMLSQAPVQDRARFRRDLRNAQMGSSGF